MTMFATADDFAARLGITLTDDEVTRAEALLTMASGQILDEANGQKIELVTDDVLTRAGTTDDRILLPQRPVVSVSSVMLDGTEIGDWYLVGNTLFRKSTLLTLLGVLDGPYLLGSAYFGRPDQTLEITYSHGYADEDIPETVRTVCKEMVVRVWINPGSVARETIGDTTTTYDNMRFSPTGLLMTTDEKKAIRKVFGRRAGSVTVNT